MDLRFKAAEAAKLIDTSAIDVARLGQIIVPDIPAHGKGFHSLYSFRNLVEMQLAGRMAAFGVPQKRIQRLIIALRTSRCQWLNYEGRDGFIICDDSWRWSAGETLEVAIRSIPHPMPALAVIIVDLAAIKMSIRKNIELNIIEGEVLHE